MALGDLLLDKETEEGEIFKIFYCPGCRVFHLIQLNIAFDPHFSWNGDNKKPTFTPAYRLKDEFSDETLCHVAISNGRLRYMSDSKHQFAGFIIEMKEA